jgi:SAM-dependent methyltransferase
VSEEELPMFRCIAETLQDEIHATWKRPSRMLKLLRPNKISNVVRRSLMRAKIENSWQREGGFEMRAYNTYNDYIKHQQSKLDLMELQLETYDIEYRSWLRERLLRLPVEWAGKSVLCLAARIGTEVKAFIDVGAFAVGIDLNPGKGNSYVVSGDFHNLQFAPRSVDVVFTNSLDHAFDLKRLMAQVKRVLKLDGLFVTEISVGRSHGAMPGTHESFFWSKPEDLIEFLATTGFELSGRTPFAYPSQGEQLLFRPKRF